MNTEIFDPKAQSPAAISMTHAAQRHVRRQLAKERADALLLGITESGCNGYMYELRYVEDQAGAVADEVRAFDFDGVTVLVDDADWPLVAGTEIDYVTEGLNAVLKFRNPNATGECGCGESFSVGASNPPTR